MVLGKFERNAAVHLAKEIKDREDMGIAVLKIASDGLSDKSSRTPFDIMKEALARLDIDTDDYMVERYVGYWVQDAKVINEFVEELRK